MPIPIYLISFNRLTWLRQLAEQCQAFPNSAVVIVDNASTYPPLVDWLRQCPYEVVRLTENIGHLSPWRGGVIRSLAEQEARWGTPYYAVSDHDLSLENVPPDALTVLCDGLTKWPQTVKAGLSLAIDAVHPHWHARVQAWEAAFWTQPADETYFHAAVDTTFAVYHSRVPAAVAETPHVQSLRSRPPYTAKHLPWHLDLTQLSDEDRYYWRMCNSSANWMPAAAASNLGRPDFRIPQPEQRT